MLEPNDDELQVGWQESVYYGIPASEENTASVCAQHGIAIDDEEFLSAINAILEDEGLSKDEMSLGHLLDAAHIATIQRHKVHLSEISEELIERMRSIGAP